MRHEQIVDASEHKPAHPMASSAWAEVWRVPILMLCVLLFACVPVLIWYSVTHWSIVAQWLEIALTLALAMGGVRAYFYIHERHHAKRMRDYDAQERALELRMKQEYLNVMAHGRLMNANVKVLDSGAFEVQHFYAPVRVSEVASQKQIEAPPVVLPLRADGLTQPTQRYLIEQLEENALQVSPGIRAGDGSPVVLSIVDAVHFKLIGSSGFGKSCLAAALLDQAIRLNSPQVLQVALLDLEHKTSRLFENAPNVATFQVGHRLVQMVATTADEVAVHLGYLKKELDRRAQLSEFELLAEPLLLIYVEEMLSLQYEVDEKLLAQMLKDLSVLAVRARKYGMFLLACAQTDYSTPELKTAQKQFRSRIAFAVDTTAARAAGFMSTDLIKYSFAHSKQGDGLYVLETPGVASLMLSPVYNVKQKVLALDARSSGSGRVSRPFQDGFRMVSGNLVNSDRNTVKPDEKPVFRFSENNEKPENSHFVEVQKLRGMGWGKVAIIEKIWNVKPGGSTAWKIAVAEYESIIDEE